MAHMENNSSKLTPTQIFTRILSVIVCGVGASACVFSLSLQIEEIGTTMSSLVWFSGLAGVVAACAGYAAACEPRKGNSWIIPAVVVGVIIAGVALMLELRYLRPYNVVFVALAALAVEAVWLLVYRQVLKRKDPYAL